MILICAALLLLTWLALAIGTALILLHPKSPTRLAATPPCDFPANPQVGDIFNCPTYGKQYTWDFVSPDSQECHWVDMDD